MQSRKVQINGSRSKLAVGEDDVNMGVEDDIGQVGMSEEVADGGFGGEAGASVIEGVPEGAPSVGVTEFEPAGVRFGAGGEGGFSGLRFSERFEPWLVEAEA